MYRRKAKGLFSHIDFILLDLICLEVSFVSAYIFRLGRLSYSSKFERLYVQVAIFLIMADIISIIFLDSYKNIIERGHYIEFIETIKQVTLVTVLLILYLYITKSSSIYSRTIFILTWELNVILAYCMHELWKLFIKKYLTKNNYGLIRMVVVTTYDEYKKLISNLVSGMRNSRYRILAVYIVDKNNVEDDYKNIPVMTSKEDIEEYMCRNWVDEVFVSLKNEYREFEEEFVEDCVVMGITVHQNIGQIIGAMGRVQVIEKINDYTVLSSAINTITLTQVIVKRTIDILGSIVGLIITGILFIFVAPVIYIKSPGPIFFTQWRVGKNGKRFKIYKFRSMYMDAEERKAELIEKNKIKDGMMFKLENDPRIIGGENGKGIGNFIRNTSIDEFPQFFNVLKGDMSLVGTRPPTLDEWKKYKLHHRARLAIKPGLTGMWQVSGRSNIDDFEEVVRLDKEYIMNWSIGLDIKIILKTVAVVLRKDGSM